ncbi:MAG: hypothetical protein MZV49_06045 [Rhodopseudomonas palustris]|nr:hypothetical protein [Rhodopseudomonas palustris]
MQELRGAGQRRSPISRSRASCSATSARCCATRFDATIDATRGAVHRGGVGRGRRRRRHRVARLHPRGGARRAARQGLRADPQEGQAAAARRRRRLRPRVRLGRARDADRARAAAADRRRARHRRHARRVGRR